MAAVVSIRSLQITYSQIHNSSETGFFFLLIRDEQAFVVFRSQCKAKVAVTNSHLLFEMAQHERARMTNDQMSNRLSSQGNADWNDDVAFHNQTGKWAVSTEVNYLVLAKMWINRLPPYWKNLLNYYNLRECGMERGCEYVQVCQITSVVFVSLQPVDCSPPGSSVCGILQARILH